MMFTEDEARKRWCPYMGAETMAQQIVNDRPLPSGLVRGGGCVGPNGEPISTSVQEQNRCIASDCMAWRVAETENVPTGREIAVTEGNLHGVVPEMKIIARGYCGLAGKP